MVLLVRAEQRLWLFRLCDVLPTRQVSFALILLSTLYGNASFITSYERKTSLLFTGLDYFVSTNEDKLKAGLDTAFQRILASALETLCYFTAQKFLLLSCPRNYYLKQIALL